MAKILIFDSGDGGRSFIGPVQDTINNAEINYLSDPEFFPYGQYDDVFIQKRLLSILSRVIGLYQPDVVLIACNTASLAARYQLRAKFKIPFVCLEPAIKPASIVTKTGRIGLLATPLTVNHPDTDRMIANYATNRTVIKYGDNRLAEAAEYKTKLSVNLIHDLRNRMVGVDTIILGCTHYHALEDQLRQALTQVKYFINPVDGVIRQIERIIERGKVAA